MDIAAVRPAADTAPARLAAAERRVAVAGTFRTATRLRNWRRIMKLTSALAALALMFMTVVAFSATYAGAGSVSSLVDSHEHE